MKDLNYLKNKIEIKIDLSNDNHSLIVYFKFEKNK